MSDLISRQAAIKYLIANMNWYYEDGYESDEDYKRVCITELINEVPSAQPTAEPVRQGKWRQTYLDHEAFGERPSIFYCSACCACSNVKTNYCPNCGARMDK